MQKLILGIAGSSLAAMLIAACAMPATPATGPTAVPAATLAPATETITTTVPVTSGEGTTDTTAMTTTEPMTTTETVTTPTGSGSVVPPEDEASARLTVPTGFAVRLYTTGLDEPRLMTVGPDGQLYVANRGGGSIVRLPDADGDGLADEQQVVANDLNEPHGLEWFEDALYVAETDQISRLADQNGDGDFEDDGEKTVVTDNIPAGGRHSSRTLHFGPDGKLYVAAGSSGNNEVETDLRRAAISRFNADGTIPEDNPFVNDAEATRQPVWAEGLRNSIDFLFLADGRLWANHNGSDELGDDIPPEEIVIEVEGGQHYGWPYCYTPTLGLTPPGTTEVQDERVAFDDRLTDCAQAVPALFTDLAHQAPIGMAQYNASAFPADYQGNLYVAYHGSWNSGVPRDCKVQMIIVQDGAPVSGEPFLTGFRDNEQQDCGDAWGRPAGVAVGANGELFVSDDQNGNVYRVVYVGE